MESIEHTNEVIMGMEWALQDALSRIEEIEADKHNYVCPSCEYDIYYRDHEEDYAMEFKGLDFTEEDFKLKRCPYCGGIMRFNSEFYKEFTVFQAESHVL